MSGTKVSSRGSREGPVPGRSGWVWHPPLPLKAAPVFVWPPRPLAALRYLLSRAFLGSVMIPFAALATITWLWLQPPLERCAVLGLDWILLMYARNPGSCCSWRADCTSSSTPSGARGRSASSTGAI